MHVWNTTSKLSLDHFCRARAEAYMTKCVPEAAQNADMSQQHLGETRVRERERAKARPNGAETTEV